MRLETVDPCAPNLRNPGFSHRLARTGADFLARSQHLTCYQSYDLGSQPDGLTLSVVVLAILEVVPFATNR